MNAMIAGVEPLASPKAIGGILVPKQRQHPMTNCVVEATVCHECYAVLDATDNYCRHCGTSTADRTDSSPGERTPSRYGVGPVLAVAVDRPKWSESPWFVLPMLFLAFGPFALPLLWRSRRFTLLWKTILTVFMVGVIVFLLWQIWFILHQSLTPLLELDKLQGF
jgi:hypothetical protein